MLLLFPSPLDPAVLKILHVVNLLRVVNLLSHCDLLSRAPCADIVLQARFLSKKGSRRSNSGRRSGSTAQECTKYCGEDCLALVATFRVIGVNM